MNELKITYDEILSSISNFQRAKQGIEDGISTTIRAIGSFKSSGLIIPGSSYDDSLTTIQSTLEAEKGELFRDCARIEKYLSNLAETAKLSVSKSVDAVEAVSTFEATGETVKRA